MTMTTLRAKLGDFPTVQAIQEAVNEYVEEFCNEPWPSDDWFTICNDHFDVNVWVDDETAERKITIYAEDDQGYGISIPVLGKTVGSAVMEMADPGELAKGHDSKGLAGEILIPLSEKCNETQVLLDSVTKEFIKFIKRENNDDTEIDFFTDIIINAAESFYGVSYWSGILKYKNLDRKGYLKLLIEELPDGFNKKVVEVSRDDLERDFARIVANKDIQKMNINWLDMDAADCESIIQVYFFDKIVYG